jgi:hypothetical protein
MMNPKSILLPLQALARSFGSTSHQHLPTTAAGLPGAVAVPIGRFLPPSAPPKVLDPVSTGQLLGLLTRGKKIFVAYDRFRHGWDGIWRDLRGISMFFGSLFQIQNRGPTMFYILGCSMRIFYSLTKSHKSLGVLSPFPCHTSQAWMNNDDPVNFPLHTSKQSSDLVTNR